MACMESTCRTRRGRKRLREREVGSVGSKPFRMYDEKLKREGGKSTKSLANHSFYSLLNLLSDGITNQLRLIGKHHYVNCIIVVDDKILSGGADSTIKIWNSTTFQCETTIDAHSAAVLYLLQMKDKVLSCSADNSIKVWNTLTWKCERTLTGHEHGVYTLMKEGDTVVTASVDRTIKVWNTSNWECTSTETLPTTYPS